MYLIPTIIILLIWILSYVLIKRLNPSETNASSLDAHSSQSVNKADNSRKVKLHVKGPMFFPGGFDNDMLKASAAMMDITYYLTVAKELTDELFIGYVKRDNNKIPITASTFEEIPKDLKLFFPGGLKLAADMWNEKGKEVYSRFPEIIVNILFPDNNALDASLAPYRDEILLMNAGTASMFKTKLRQALRR